MRPLIKKLGRITGLFLFSCFVGFHYSGFPQSTDDSLYKKYLSDTLHAATKIRTLVRDAVDKSDNPVTTVARFELALSLVPYATDSNGVVALLYAQFSTWLLNAGALELAIEYAKKALVLGKQHNGVNQVTLYHLDARVAGLYLNVEKFDSAGRYYYRALNDARQYRDPLYIASACNNIGFFYEKEVRPDSALSMFRYAESLLPLSNKVDSELLGSIHDNVAINYFRRKEMDSALHLYNQNVTLYTRLLEDHKILQAKIGIMHCHIAKRNFAAAYALLEAVKLLAQQDLSLQKPEFRLQVLNAFMDYNTAVNNWPAAFAYQHQVKELSDSINKQNKNFVDEVIRASIESEMAKADKQIQMQKLMVSQAQSKAIRNLIAVFIVGLLSIAVVLLIVTYYRNRNRLINYEKELTQKELENKKLEQEKLARELVYKKGDLNDLSIYLSRIKDLHENIAERIHDVKVVDPQHQKIQLKEIAKELEVNSDLHNRAAMIQQNIESINNEFHGNLLKKYPGLTKSELELCGLVRLKLSNKEIGAIKNVSADSIKRARNRLKNKIGVLPEEDLASFVGKI